jgi:murein tripeptide amidase MpaA
MPSKLRTGFVLSFLLATSLLGVGVRAAPPSEDADRFPRVVRVFYESVDDIRALYAFDLWEYSNVEERYVLVMVDAAEYAELAELGFPLELDEARTAEIQAPREVLPSQTSGIPGFPCYRTVEETYATAQQIVFDHSELATWEDVGDSWEKENGVGGYDMRVLRLTNRAVPGPKPKLFITSAIHAREYAPAELMTRVGEYLVDNYGVDADATWLLDHHEVHLMLQANPDGRKKAETGLYWRKNTNQNYCSPTSNNRGADLNRNFEFQWACCGGASNYECDELYRGPFAASEPETGTVQGHLLTEFPDQKPDPLDSPVPDDATGVYMDIHASGGLVLWPWGFGGSSPNMSQLQTFGRKLAYYNGYVPKQAVDLYPTDGNTIDFAYGEQGVAAMAYEIGTQFFQDCAYFENVILPDNLPSFVYAAKVARTPYLTPAGPDALDLEVTPASVYPGETFELTATLDDTRYNNSQGVEPVQAIARGEYYLDLPPWSPGSPAAAGMFAADGSFDTPVEAVTAVVSTTGLDPGRHIIFVRGRDAADNWGAFSAIFIDVADDQADDDGDGVPNGVDCAPGDISLWAPPSPARDLTVSKGAVDNLAWLPPADPGAFAVAYHVLRSSAAHDFDAAGCTAVGTSTTATDGQMPASGETFFYLIRTTNPCGKNLGYDSVGRPRSGAPCLF